MRLRLSVTGVCLDDRQRIGADIDADPKGRGHSVGRDVVMGRTDAAGGEDIIMAGPQCVEGVDDDVGLVRHDPAFHHIDPQRGEEAGDLVEVLVLGTTGQDLVANEKNRCRHTFARGHENRP
jgi:hypothetical protein